MLCLLPLSIIRERASLAHLLTNLLVISHYIIARLIMNVPMLSLFEDIQEYNNSSMVKDTVELKNYIESHIIAFRRKRRWVTCCLMKGSR